MLIGSDTASPQLPPPSPETHCLIFNKPDLLPHPIHSVLFFFPANLLISDWSVLGPWRLLASLISSNHQVLMKTWGGKLVAKSKKQCYGRNGAREGWTRIWEWPYSFKMINNIYAATKTEHCKWHFRWQSGSWWGLIWKQQCGGVNSQDMEAGHRGVVQEGKAAGQWLQGRAPGSVGSWHLPGLPTVTVLVTGSVQGLYGQSAMRLWWRSARPTLKPWPSAGKRKGCPVAGSKGRSPSILGSCWAANERLTLATQNLSNLAPHWISL